MKTLCQFLSELCQDKKNAETQALYKGNKQKMIIRNNTTYRTKNIKIDLHEFSFHMLLISTAWLVCLMPDFYEQLLC